MPNCADQLRDAIANGEVETVKQILKDISIIPHINHIFYKEKVKKTAFNFALEVFSRMNHHWDLRDRRAKIFAILMELLAVKDSNGNPVLDLNTEFEFDFINNTPETPLSRILRRPHLFTQVQLEELVCHMFNLRFTDGGRVCNLNYETLYYSILTRNPAIVKNLLNQLEDGMSICVVPINWVRSFQPKDSIVPKPGTILDIVRYFSYPVYPVAARDEISRALVNAGAVTYQQVFEKAAKNSPELLHLSDQINEILHILHGFTDVLKAVTPRLNEKLKAVTPRLNEKLIDAINKISNESHESTMASFKSDFGQLEQFDQYAKLTKLIYSVWKDYKGTNKNRVAAIFNLVQATGHCYEQFAKGRSIEECKKILSEHVKFVRRDIYDDHMARSEYHEARSKYNVMGLQFFGKYRPESRLVQMLDTVIAQIQPLEADEPNNKSPHLLVRKCKPG
jgi:hypothetical protein